MKILLANTGDEIKLQRTQLTATVIAGSSVVIPVANSNGFAVSGYVVIGEEGSEGAELCKITAVATGSITVQTLLAAHFDDEPVTLYRYNMRKFYGATTATGSYTELTSFGSPVTIQVGDPQGAFCEYTGTTYAYFKATYWNSTTSEESAIADAEVFTGSDSSRYTSLYNIRVQSGLLKNPFITNARVETKRKQAENEVNSYLLGVYSLPLTEIPDLIVNVTTLLAAGYLDYEEFGAEGLGVKWLGEARGILRSIQKGNQHLIGADGTELTTPSGTSSGVQSYPDTVDNNSGPVRRFTTSQRF